MKLYFNTIAFTLYIYQNRGRRGRDRMVLGFTTTYVISAYHHWCCELESGSGRGVQHYVIKFVSDLWQVGGFFPGTLVSSTNGTDRYDIAEILLKVALNIIKQTNKQTLIKRSNIIFFSSSHLLPSMFFYIICINYVLWCPVQHDLYIWGCPCSLTVTQWPTLLEQELLTHPSTCVYPRFCGVCVAQVLVFCVVLCRSLFVSLSFGHCCVCPSV